MPKNPILFPTQFTLDGEIAESGLGALEVAVNNLGVAAKLGAMRQANAIRMGGLGSIKNQNRNLVTLGTFLPTRSVGRFTTPPPEPVGTVGYFLGGYSLIGGTQLIAAIDRFTFASNTVVFLGNFAPLGYRYCFTFANRSLGYFAMVNLFSRLTFQSESFNSLGISVFPGRYIGASLRTPSRGYACGGTNNESGGQSFSAVDRFSFAGEVCVAISSSVVSRTHSSGFGNRFSGYLAGGINNGVGSIPTTTIERFSYSSETSAVLSSTLSAARYGISSWTSSSAFAGYLMSGMSYGRFPDPVNSAFRDFRTRAIDKFTYTGETVSLLGVTTSFGVIVYASAGNSSRSFIAGGYRHSDAYEVQAANMQQETAGITALTFATETLGAVGDLSRSRFALSAVDNS